MGARRDNPETEPKSFLAGVEIVPSGEFGKHPVPLSVRATIEK